MAKKYGNVELLPIEKKEYGNVELLPIEPKPATYGNVELLPITMPTTKRYGNVELLPTPTKTYEIDVGKYPLIIPTSVEAEIEKDRAFPDLYVKGMWQDEAEKLAKLPKTQYKPINVDDREYKGLVKNVAFNYLQRGEFAVANALDAVLKGDTNVTKAVIDGFTGKQKRDFTDIALGLGFEGIEAIAVGMVAGVTLDPINYIPFGKIYKGLSKTMGKTKALQFIDETSVATFLKRAFTAEEGSPKALHKMIKNLKKHKRYDETLVFEEIEKLSKMMKKPKNAELITKVRELRAPMESLTTIERGILKRIDEGYKHIASMGVKSGILDPKYLKENYTHYYFEGLTKTATNIKNGHAGAPAFAKLRHIDNIIDYDNARTALIESVQKALKSKNIDEARRLIETFPMAKSGSTLVGNASTYTARQTGLNALENYGYRKLEHIGAMYRQKVINTVVDPKMPYARPISKMTSRTARPGHELYVIRYRIPDINLKESDDVGRALYKQLLRTADSDIVQIEPRLAMQIQNSKYMQKFFKGKGPRIFEMRKEIADYMNETSQMFRVGNPTLEAILKSATAIQNKWKPLATIARPFWHVRNITFNQMQLYLSGLNPLDLVGRAIQAGKIQKGGKGFLLTDKFGKVSLQKLSKESRKLGLYGAGFAGGDIATAKLITSKMKSALRGGKLTLGDIVGLPKKAALKSAEFFEDNAHLVAWLDYISKSKDPDLGTAMIKGAEHAFKYVFDYGDLSKFEKSTMKLIDPFYAWHRKAVGLYAEELLREPGKFSNLGKLRRAFGKITPETEQEKALKGYMKSPFKIKGKQTYFYLAMPPDDLQMLSSMKDIWGAVTPYKTIVELLYGVKAFPEFGVKIEGYTPAPAWMTFLPEKTWKLLKLKPGRHIDYSTGRSTDVLQIPKSYLYAIETAMPVLRDIHTRFPQVIELAQEKATVKTWSQGTGMGLVNENLSQWRNTIVFEVGELQKELTKNAKK